MKTNLFLVMMTFVVILPCAISAQKSTPKKEIALQLYSVRDKIGSTGDTVKYDADYTSTLRAIARMGYTGIEAAGYGNGKFYNRTPEEFRRDVEAAGLRVLSSHCTKTLTPEELESGDYSESLKWWSQCIHAHKAAGMTYVVTPWLDLPATLKDLQTYCDYFNEIGEMCRKHGLKYGYHNHMQEFQQVEDKAIMLDYMIENTNPKYVFFEMDVYWAIMGKSNPVDYFNKYPGRFTVLHIKDQQAIGQSGMIDFAAIFNSTKAAGVKDIIVELETEGEALVTELKTSIDYLQRAPFVKLSYNN